MKKTGLFWTLAMAAFLASCGRKTIPTANNTNNTNVLPSSKTDPRVAKHQKDSIAIYVPPTAPTKDSAVINAPVATTYNKVFTVVDSHGRLLLDPEKSPADIAPDWIALKSLRSFTPNQAQTLASRYNTVPPKVIYIPKGLEKVGRKGTYYIYSKKFWYWKKEDGLFYLDTNYYQ